MNKTFLIAKTPTCDISYLVQYITTTPLSLKKYLDIQTFNNCCKFGCPNYNQKWSCPPCTPQYEEYVQHYNYITIVMLQTNLSQFSYIKNDYLKLKAANSILKSRIDKTLRDLKTTNTHYISTGSCRLCKPCKRKKGEFCAHPELMAYSFEAFGINVCALAQDMFNTELLWYSKHNLPQYTSVVAGLLFNNEFSATQLIEILKRYQ